MCMCMYSCMPVSMCDMHLCVRAYVYACKAADDYVDAYMPLPVHSLVYQTEPIEVQDPGQFVV